MCKNDLVCESVTDAAQWSGDMGIDRSDSPMQRLFRKMVVEERFVTSTAEAAGCSGEQRGLVCIIGVEFSDTIWIADPVGPIDAESSGGPSYFAAGRDLPRP